MSDEEDDKKKLNEYLKNIPDMEGCPPSSEINIFEMRALEKKAAEEAKPTNLLVLAQAMELLYQTYIIDIEVAKNRGEAIQAIDRMILGLGGESQIETCEAVPYGKRMRESKIWNEEPKE